MLRTPPSRTPRFGFAQSIATAFLLVTAATLVCEALDPYVSLTSQAMIYLLAVVSSAFLPRWIDSALTALLGVSALNFFFVPPRHAFQIADTDYEIALASFMVVSVVVSGIAGRLRMHTEEASERERRARQLYELGEALAGADHDADLVQRAAEAVYEAFERPCRVLVCGAQAGVHTEITVPADAEMTGLDPDAARWAVEHRETIGPTTRNWPELPAWYVPLNGTDRAFAVDVSTLSRRVTEEDRRHLETMTRQVAAALQRVRLTASAREAALAAEAESVRNALLASISHDMRTPLAVIVGSASTLAQHFDRVPAPEREALLRAITDEASQLSVVAENVLQMARLSSGELALRRDWESIEEIVGSVMARLRRRALDGRVRANVPGDLPLVRIDGVLVAQVIVNLVDNALKYSPSDSMVEIDASRRGDCIEIAVKDYGPGIDPADLPRLFMKFHRGNTESSQTGVGLGLAICKAVVEAHGGAVSARNRLGGGAEFSFTLPIGGDAPPVQDPSQ